MMDILHSLHNRDVLYAALGGCKCDAVIWDAVKGHFLVCLLGVVYVPSLAGKTDVCHMHHCMPYASLYAYIWHALLHQDQKKNCVYVKKEKIDQKKMYVYPVLQCNSCSSMPIVISLVSIQSLHWPKLL